MFYGHTEKIEVTSDKNVVNKLLNAGWILQSVNVSEQDGFVFLLGWHGQPRAKVFRYFSNGEEISKTTN